MDRTPSEIWTKIFSHACTDSGATGRRLSLVSKSIRELSAPVKLQSMSIHGLRHVTSFHKLLLQTPPHLRRIRYLFISTIPLPPARRGLPRFFPSSRTSEAGAEMGRDEWEQMRHVCQCVLAEVAEWIEIMYLDVGPTQYSPVLTFPRLTELTSYGFPLPSLWLSDDKPTSALCPQLRRWHIMRFPPMDPLDVFETITTVAPSLTHLRFSGLQQNSSFARDLETALSGSNGDSCTGRLPASIQKVYVKPLTAPPWGPCATAKMSYGQLMRGLEELNKADSRLVLLKKYKEDGERMCTSGEWLDRINGGQGCWSLRGRISA
ncbi:hypothetical protein FIBSPDRAFT_796367 [Athelia psychrophila]|uniref:F-box domain-containing protein n=1 Tax=Athelia psychrophila TaxID=1759441 RepID=A0A166DJY4_9AGAM|nr:hypothetical protein FIBSPDRAFT_796367 [Fibularhizoctonia sp. CBS 109695]